MDVYKIFNLMKFYRFLEHAYENEGITPVSPENDVVLHVSKVWKLVRILATKEVSENIRARATFKYGYMKCSHCYMPVLEHIYDITRDGEEIVLHWKGNCAIGPIIKKGAKTLHLVKR